MPDGLSAEDRRLIDEAIAAGKVTKVPRGATAQIMPRFDAETNSWYSVDGVTGQRLTSEEAKSHWRRQGQRRITGQMAEARAKRAIPQPTGPTPATIRRREEIGALAATLTAAEIAERLAIAEGTVHAHLAKLGLRAQRKSKANAADELVARFRAPGRSMADIAERAGLNYKTVRSVFERNGWPKPDGRRRAGGTNAENDQHGALATDYTPSPAATANRAGIEVVAEARQARAAAGPQATTPKGRPSHDKAAQRKLAAREKALAKVRDRRRFRTTPVPTGETRVIAPHGLHGTMFPTRVETPGEAPVLKDGAHSSKLVGDVLVGRLKGARILTLTLEERRTCPVTCAVYRTCYGNAMQHSVRWQIGAGLIDAIRRDLARECAAHDQVLVRLHVLGDFFAVEYVAFWAAMLKLHPNLSIFGFTAWHPGTQIGDAVARVRRWHGQRFSVRHSGLCGTWGSFVMDEPVEDKSIGGAVVCPEQRDAMNGVEPGRARHCGSCGFCWSGEAAVAFVRH